MQAKLARRRAQLRKLNIFFEADAPFPLPDRPRLGLSASGRDNTWRCGSGGGAAAVSALIDLKQWAQERGGSGGGGCVSSGGGGSDSSPRSKEEEEERRPSEAAQSADQSMSTCAQPSCMVMSTPDDSVVSPMNISGVSAADDRGKDRKRPGPEEEENNPESSDSSL
jgi:hypothetical protein